MRVYIIGPEESGKSTAARFLAQSMNLPIFETDSAVFREIAKLCKCGDSVVQDLELISAGVDVCRDSFRKTGRYMRNLMTTLKPTALVDRHLAAYADGIVVGVQYQREVEALTTQKRVKACQPVWIRINRLDHDARNFELNDIPVDFDVLNISLRGLKAKMHEIACELQPLAVQKAAA